MYLRNLEELGVVEARISHGGNKRQQNNSGEETKLVLIVHVRESDLILSHV